jgi:hypothetical protein
MPFFQILTQFLGGILSEYTVREKLFGIMQVKSKDIRYCSRKVEEYNNFFNEKRNSVENIWSESER